jgi:hypothetical protein
MVPNMFQYISPVILVELPKPRMKSAFMRIQLARPVKQVKRARTSTLLASKPLPTHSVAVPSETDGETIRPFRPSTCQKGQRWSLIDEIF